MKPPISGQRRPRGRPARTAARTEATRARVVAIAETLFRTEGYASVSMRRIAAECGCTTATLYAYFPAKIDILRGLWGGIFEELFAAYESESPGAADAAEMLGGLAIFYARYWIGRPERYRLVFMSEGIATTDVDAFISEEPIVAKFQRLRDSVAAALPAATPDRIVRLKADVLVCVLHGAAHNIITIGGYPWTQVEEMVAEAVDGLLR